MGQKRLSLKRMANLNSADLSNTLYREVLAFKSKVTLPKPNISLIWYSILDSFCVITKLIRSFLSIKRAPSPSAKPINHCNQL